MPELPEVQTLINNLIEEGVCDKKITDVEVYMSKLLKNIKLNDFKKTLIGSKIKRIERLGKYLLFILDNKKVMAVHLRMEGKLFFQNSDELFDKKHTLLIIKMNKMELRYHDTRRFGTFHIYNENDYLKSNELSKIEIDPLNQNFDWKFLKNKISMKNKVIKTALLDQSNISGIGNIYADEILFASRINPTKGCKELTDNDFKNIENHARRILKLAVENKGTTIFSYLFKKDQGGQFQKFLKVHLKKGKPCPRCKTIIEKMKVNGRGTYYCPKCQKC